MDPLSWTWLVFIVSFVFVLLSYSPEVYNFLPHLIKDVVVYGKLLDPRKRTGIQQYLLVPKRWFVHFYILSFIWNGFILMNVVQCTLQGSVLPLWFSKMMSFLTSYPVSPPAVDLLTVLIAMAVIVIHAHRRIYECLAVSVYSNSSIHVTHYITGIFFYSFIGISIMAEGPNLSLKGEPIQLMDLVEDLRWHHIAGLLMFVWASWHHHIAHVIFASLRKTKKDVSRHMIPQGDWFDYVSCPHYLAETLIYTSLAVILGGHHRTWWLVLSFVFSNQTAASVKVHRWYQGKFEDYPKERKAFMPFVF
ncbi:polyprenol reductase isoform X2 [Strongylocentrotus purpuratus]|uniref:Polyprenal reductase n=1 Tax=Strongylocentrotus purpuratus TaxID=7668 RepID=A0A7M7RB95_STRPU|nr:polyprenol reductase isoform X2 [Strongylocentrotus purpuratus]|eukprot:XP_785169.3 PREDICTED: polyprenol reductase isoform X2 [Strongylocentrotus purpuratus]